MVPVQESICKVCPYRGQSVFSGLSDGRLDEFCGLKLVNHYKKDQRIFYEGEPNMGLFILCSGKVKLSRTAPSGKRQIVDMMGPCGLLDEKDLFLRDQRTVTAEAIEDCLVCFIKKSDFIEFLKLNSPVAIKIIERLSEQLERAEEKIEALTVMEAKQRLADLLLRLGGRYGKETPEGRLVEIPLTREEIAEIMGATQETVIRILSKFKKDEIVKEVGKRTLLLNEDRLKAIAWQ